MKKKTKKLLSVLIAVIMLLSSVPLQGFIGLDLPLFNFTVQAATTYTSGDYIYIIENGNAIITDVNSKIKGKITVPSTLDGYTVTGIGSNFFRF